ncbi:DM13 domain-containing protein [Nodosilinea nodulosa]|uniref:DM13 domain-containing protein n=1 Tax=Nodosilinea nodulosa TaxID=416001 RepID=UPI0002E20A2C|nr:DM13 domain-containing protein [Nodosilinea nodulosa]
MKAPSPLTTATRRLTLCSAIAVATPLLVLANALLSSADRAIAPPVVPLRPLLETPPRLYAASQSLATAYRAWMMTPDARIVAENNQLFLEFYTPFNLLAQGPDLSLVLVKETVPVDNSRHSQDALFLGKMHAAAGKHRYPIAVPMAESTSINETIRQYHSVILWCSELNAMVAYSPLEIELLVSK